MWNNFLRVPSGQKAWKIGDFHELKKKETEQQFVTFYFLFSVLFYFILLYFIVFFYILVFCLYFVI